MEGKALSLYSAFPVQEVINLKLTPFYFARFDQFKALTEFSLLITPNISVAEKRIFLQVAGRYPCLLLTRTSSLKQEIPHERTSDLILDRNEESLCG